MPLRPAVLVAILAMVLSSLVPTRVVHADNPLITISVDTTANRHPISDYVYGLAYADSAALTDLRPAGNRRGGNNTSRYNWQQNADNRGNDWFYESIAYDSATPGADVDDFIAETRAGNSEPMVTIPMVGWVAKLGPGRSKLASFSAMADFSASLSCASCSHAARSSASRFSLSSTVSRARACPSASRRAVAAASSLSATFWRRVSISARRAAVASTGSEGGMNAPGLKSGCLP